jgi:hypothetical protein
MTDTCLICDRTVPPPASSSGVGAREPGQRLPDATTQRAVCECGARLIRTQGDPWQVDARA